MTTTAAAPIAEPKVRRRLRRRPPASIRNGRALLVSVAGYGFMVLFAAILGMFIGIKGVPGVLPLIAIVTIPLGLVCIAISRLTCSWCSASGLTSSIPCCWNTLS